MSRTTSTSITALVPALPREALRKLSEMLEPGEQVAWCGQPIPARRTRASLRGQYAGFGLCFACLAWVGAALPPQERILVIVVACGLAALLASMIYMTRRSAAHSLFAITDRRVLVIEPCSEQTRLFGENPLAVKAYLPHLLQNIEVSALPDGSGDVVFAKRTERTEEGKEYVVSEGLLNVADVRDVERRVRALAAMGSVCT